MSYYFWNNSSVFLLLHLSFNPCFWQHFTGQCHTKRFSFFTGLGIRSFQKNRTIFAFFSVLYKRTERFLRSFPFFIKERNILFGFISHTNIANLAKKNVKRTESSVRFSIYIHIYMSIYIFIYLYIYLYISIYILKIRTQHSAFFCRRTKRSRVLLRSLQNNIAFFSVLKKRMEKNASFFLGS